MNIESLLNSNLTLLYFTNAMILNTAPITEKKNTAKFIKQIIIYIKILIQINIRFLNPPKNVHLTIVKIEIIPNTIQYNII